MSATEFELARMLAQGHPNMYWLCESIACPQCQAAVGETCQTRSGKSTDMPHVARRDTFRCLVS